MVGSSVGGCSALVRHCRPHWVCLVGFFCFLFCWRWTLSSFLGLFGRICVFPVPPAADIFCPFLCPAFSGIRFLIFSDLQIVFFAVVGSSVGGCFVFVRHFRPLWVCLVCFSASCTVGGGHFCPLWVCLVGFVRFLFRLRRTFFAPFLCPAFSGIRFLIFSVLLLLFWRCACSIAGGGGGAAWRNWGEIRTR